MNRISGLPSFSRRTLASLAGGLLLTASLAGSAFAADTIKVGIMSGEDEDLWKVVAAQAEKSGLTIETVVFSDYTQPNEALDRGEIDANAFQHKPYLDNQIESRGYRIVPVGFTAVWPIGLYSKKFDKVADLPEGALIGVPNDPSNEGRALHLLQHEDIIELQEGTGILATPIDISESPKNVEIKELDAGIVGRAIDDLDAAVVNTDWALKVGLDPETDLIAQEPIEDNPYRNFIAVREESVNEPWVKTLVTAYQNDEVEAELARVYKGTGLPAW